MKKLFKEQLEGNPKVTEENLLALKNKLYDNGDSIMVGDQVMFAMLINPEVVNGQMSMKLITLNERHFDDYERYDEIGEYEIPVIKVKK
jgi:hypothetical protein